MVSLVIEPEKKKEKENENLLISYSVKQNCSRRQSIYLFIYFSDKITLDI